MISTRSGYGNGPFRAMKLPLITIGPIVVIRRIYVPIINLIKAERVRATPYTLEFQIGRPIIMKEYSIIFD